MQQILSPTLEPIYRQELSFGNTVARIENAQQPALPLVITFERPLHRAQIESLIKVTPPITWWSVGSFEGYVSEDTGQSLLGPTSSIAERERNARQRLSPNLQIIYDLELSFGNSVVRIDAPAGSSCPLAIIFKNPLNKNKIEASISLPVTVKWLENHDTHYPIQGGYKCNETSHVVAGPLPKAM